MKTAKSEDLSLQYKSFVNIPVTEMPKKFIISLLDGYCNLKCPMCFVHSGNKSTEAKSIRGIMPLDKACRIFDEIKLSAQCQISPNTWSEPFMLANIKEYLLAMKERSIPVTINTNGLLLTNELAHFLVEIKTDSIFFSVDATTKNTLKKIRGIETIEKLKEAVFTMLSVRGNRPYPRIGVSFVEEEGNRHEKEEFISYWLEYADTVRIMQVYDANGRVKNAVIPKNRIPCGSLYDTMVINHKGDACLCCLDSFYKVKIGNVFKDGIRKVWHSSRFQEIRFYHQRGEFNKVPFCKNCEVWSNYLVYETLNSNILIRRTPLITHYNRMDRMYTWNFVRQNV